MRLKGFAIAGIAALTLVGCSSGGAAPAKEGTPTEQLAAAAPHHVDLARHQPVDDQEAAVVGVALDRRCRVPDAR